MFLSHATAEDTHRKSLTDFAMKIAFLGAGAGLILELFYFYAVLTPELRTADQETHFLLIITVGALIALVILLLLNQLKIIPEWFAPTVFLLALIIFALFCDTPENVMNGRSTMVLLMPILLAGVLIHAYAPFVFTTLVVFLLAAMEVVVPGDHMNPVNVIFLYIFSGMVCIIFWNLENATRLLHREVEQSETILSALRGGYILADKNLHILRLNEKTSDIFPLAKLNASLLDAVQDKGLEISGEDLQNLTAVITGENAEEVRIEISGKHYYAASKYVPATKEHLIFLRDITAEVEIERLKDTALAMVSHELRTPLTAIRGHAEMALRDPLTAVSNATRILLNSQRMLIMVENLLSQSRLRTGKIKCVPSPTNIETVFRVVHSLFRSETEEKGLGFTMEVDRDIPVLMTDAILLQQILTNLASNAIKFCEKGQVRLIADMPDNTHWRISVSDTGPGIPASKRTEIFKEFFQGTTDTVYHRRHQGNGLGLSIVKGLTEQMGGKLTLRTEEGVGSDFSIVFPLIIPPEITRKRK